MASFLNLCEKYEIRDTEFVLQLRIMIHSFIIESGLRLESNNGAYTTQLPQGWQDQKELTYFWTHADHWGRTMRSEYSLLHHEIVHKGILMFNLLKWDGNKVVGERNFFLPLRYSYDRLVRAAEANSRSYAKMTMIVKSVLETSKDKWNTQEMPIDVLDSLYEDSENM